MKIQNLNTGINVAVNYKNIHNTQMATYAFNENLKLLQNYSVSLEMENKAKNVQTALLYQQISILEKQNQSTISQLQTIRKLHQDNVEEQKRYLGHLKMLQKHNYELQTKLNEIQMKANPLNQISKIQQQNLALKEQLEQKYFQIEQKKQKNIQIQQFESQLNKEALSLNQAIEEAEEAKKYYVRKIRQLKENNSRLNQKIQQQSQNSYIKIDQDRIVKDNNSLIQKICALQKEKNSYYSELKAASPIQKSYKNKIWQDSKKKNTNAVKIEQWSQMQYKINVLKCENQELKANLYIK